MTTLIIGAVLLGLGNLIVGNRRTVTYGSAEHLRAGRLVSVGTAINILAAVLLVVGVFSLEPPLRNAAIGVALMFWGWDVSTRASVTCREHETGTPERRSSERAISIGAVIGIVGGVLLIAGIWSLL